jgi:hypothetical protein
LEVTTSVTADAALLFPDCITSNEHASVTTSNQDTERTFVLLCVLTEAEETVKEMTDGTREGNLEGIVSL